MPLNETKPESGSSSPAMIRKRVDFPLPDAPSPRERIHAVLKSGAVAILAQYADSPGLRAAAERNDVLVLPGTRPEALVESGRADLAVFDETGACIATVCAGRLVHRRR